MKNAFTLAALCAVTPVLFAQDDKKDDKKKPAGTEQAMPNPKHQAHDMLKSLAGDWETVMKSEAMPGVPGMEKAAESKGVEHAELVCNGLWLKSVVNATWQGAPFQGVWLAGYDPFKKSYACVWVSSDAEDCGACTMDGNYDEKTKTWTWTGKSSHGEMRSSFVHKDADTTVETCYMKSPDGKEAKCMEITRKRSKAPVAVDASAAKAAKGLAKEQEALHKDIGEWDAVVKMQEAGQQPTEEKGSEKVEPLCSGRWMWTDFKSQFFGQPFEGHALYGYDPNEKKYVSFWIDTMTPVAMKTSGTADASQKTYNMNGTCIDEQGKPMTVKQSFTAKDDSTRVLQMEFKSPEKTSNMEITYKRRGK